MPLGGACLTGAHQNIIPDLEPQSMGPGPVVSIVVFCSLMTKRRLTTHENQGAFCCWTRRNRFLYFGARGFDNFRHIYLEATG